MKRAILIGLFIVGALAAGAARADTVFTNLVVNPTFTGTTQSVSFTTNASTPSEMFWDLTDVTVSFRASDAGTVSFLVNLYDTANNLIATRGDSFTLTAGTRVFPVLDFSGVRILQSTGLYRLEMTVSGPGAIGITGGVLNADIQGGATSVPAPAGLALLGLGSAGLAFIRRRKTQKA